MEGFPTLFGWMPASEKSRVATPVPEATPEDFAGRLRRALKAAGKSQSRAQREIGLSQGYMSKLLSGDRGTKALAPELIRRLADYLGVAYEWLAIGRGPMHREGWAPSPLEAASVVAVTWGARRDAIEAAIEKHRDTPDMTEWDWLSAINTEASRLDRGAVPRPEVVEKGQARFRRLQNKKKRRVKVTEEYVEPPRIRRGGAA